MPKRICLQLCIFRCQNRLFFVVEFVPFCWLQFSLFPDKCKRSHHAATGEPQIYNILYLLYPNAFFVWATLRIGAKSSCNIDRVGTNEEQGSKAARSPNPQACTARNTSRCPRGTTRRARRPLMVQYTKHESNEARCLLVHAV